VVRARVPPQAGQRFGQEIILACTRLQFSLFPAGQLAGNPATQ
jgi:hypothetical protein